MAAHMKYRSESYAGIFTLTLTLAVVLVYVLVDYELYMTLYTEPNCILIITSLLAKVPDSFLYCFLNWSDNFVKKKTTTNISLVCLGSVIY